MVRLLILSGFLATSAAIGQTGLPAISVNQTADGTEYSLTHRFSSDDSANVASVTVNYDDVFCADNNRDVSSSTSYRHSTNAAKHGLVGISLFLSFFIMSPIFVEIYDESITPYLNDQINAEQAIQIAEQPLRDLCCCKHERMI